jgi:hypothetical protein
LNTLWDKLCITKYYKIDDFLGDRFIMIYLEFY